MPIWWRTVDLPVSIETLASDSRDAASAAVAQAAYDDLNQRQLLALSVSSFVAGGLSLIATIVAVASFLRMRRSFRHDLILLLILSDMLKTLWLVILPATELVRGTVASASSLCQISGYFLSVGIESCDLAVLLMAIHTGLYIFRGRTGLYPYRFSAYAVVAVVSLMLASLAFINKPAFVNSGPYCYLPSQPRWTTRALSWIPRYVVVLTIMLTYTCIYAYVRLVMTKSEKRERFQNADESHLVDRHHEQESCLLPRTPPIAYHGLIPPTPPCDQVMSDDLVLGSGLNLPNQDQETASVEIPSLVSQSNVRTYCGLSSLVLSNNTRQEETSNSHRLPYPCGGQVRLASAAPPMKATAQRGSPQKPNFPANLRLQAPAGFLLDGQSPEDYDGGIALPQLILSPATLYATGMPRVREKIRRQLGQLFVYPLVYMAGWVIPFISHVVGSDKTGQPFWLVLASLISLCVQGLADSVVFLMLEKPWRYWTRDDVKAWCCFWWSKHSSIKGTEIKVGRTREEMLIDSAIARRRREREQAEGRLRSAGHGPKHRDWWDLTLVEIEESIDEDAGLASRQLVTPN